MAQSPFTPQAAYPATTPKTLTAIPGSDVYQLITTVNNLLNAIRPTLAYLGLGSVPITTSTLSAGTTVTVACTASLISISGATPVLVAAETAKAFGSLGTIPANTWGLIVVQRIANATTDFVSAAANYTTGYANEAAALAAMPAQTAAHAVVGWLTILAGGSGWVAGTDALFGNTGGNPAIATNYYSNPGAADTATWANVKQITGFGGTAVTA